jgi:GNAT superfamily N-acetyltransferase
MTSSYRLRPATSADVDAIVAQRIGMFTDMNSSIDADALSRAFRPWLADAIESGVYHGWLVEAENGAVVAGGGMTVVPWPPGPFDLTGRIAFVYNVYTAPAHRRRGLARAIMDAIHAWCGAAGIRTAALAASPEGRPLYESIGYHPPRNPYLFTSIATG